MRASRGTGRTTWNSTVKRYVPLQRSSHPIRPVGRRGREWQRVRRRFLAERRRACGQLACENCGRIPASVDVHHIVKRSLAPHLTYEPSNLRVLCRSCHRAQHTWS